MRRNAWTIFFAVAVLVANAQEKTENNGSFDSSTSIDADSKPRAEFLNKPALSVNTRKNRAIDSKLAVESESPSGHDSLALIRGPRDAEDNEDNETIATTLLPSENDDSNANYASSTISPPQNMNATEEEVDSSSITIADLQSSEKDKGAGDNAGTSNSDEMPTTLAVSSTSPTPVLSDKDDEDVKVEDEAVAQEASSPEDIPAVQASEQKAPSSEDVQGRSMSDVDALEEMHPDLDPSSSPSQDIDAQPSSASPPINVNESTPMVSSPTSTSSVEQTASEAPVSSSPSSSEVHEEASTPSPSPTSEEEAHPDAPASEEKEKDQSSASDSTDVNNDLETTTLINVVDSSSDDASPEKTSPEADAQNEETTDENEDNSLNSGMSENEDNNEATTEDDGPTDAAFEEPTASTTDGESTEETVPTVPESSGVTSTSSTMAPSSKYNFLVYDESSNVACILASMCITLRVTYTTKDKKTRVKSIQVPSTASASGFCGNKDSNLTLSWPTSGTSDEQKDTMTFTLKKDDSKFYVSNVQVSLVPNTENFPNVIDESLKGNSATDLRLFSAPLMNGAHVCRPMTEVICGQIVVLIKDVSLIAYNDRDNVADREEELCSPPAKSISIAAVVGGIVGLTVTIGIVASYAWYRKRTSTFRSELP